VRPIPDVRAADRPAPPDPNDESPWRAALRLVTPLYFVAVACFAVTYFLYASVDPTHPTRVPVWMLAFGMGLVASGGATTAVLFGDFRDEVESPAVRLESAIRRGELVVVPRATWTAMRSGVVASPHAPAHRSRPIHPATDPFGDGPIYPHRAGEGGDAALASLESLAWSEGPPEPVDVRHPAPRSADRLAEEVDALLAELNQTRPPAGSTRSPAGAVRTPTPPSPPQPTPSPRRKAAPPPRPAPIAAKPVRSERDRLAYELTLAELATSSSPAEPLVPGALTEACSECLQPLEPGGVRSTCRDCGTPFCPLCVAWMVGEFQPMVCSRCRARTP